MPTLAFDLPCDATAAIMPAAFQTCGVRPGPLLCENESALVWTLTASLFIGNAMLLDMPMIPIRAVPLRLPKPYLGLLCFASTGAYAVNAQPFDLSVLPVLGPVGLAMRRFGVPVPPFTAGVVLGPMAERRARMSLQLSGGDLSGLIGGPVSRTVYGIVALLALWPPAVLVKRPSTRDREPVAA